MRKERKTLIILTPAFAASEEESWLPSQEDFVRNLNKIYPSLRIIILAFHFPIVQNKRYIWAGNEVIAFNGGMKGKFSSLLLWIRVWRELQQIRKQHPVIGIFSFFCSESAFVGHYFAKRYHLKHFIWILGQDAKKENRQVKRMKPGEGELIAISDFLVVEFNKNHGIRPKHMIPIGIAPENFPATHAERDIDIIGVGNLGPIKRYDVFITIVKEISRTIPGIHARICGGGSGYNTLQQLIVDEGLEDNICLLGQKKHQEVLRIMQKSKILLHTSSYEGFGMVCTEALYAGAHVVSFCKPMDVAIPHWHIVHNEEEMTAKILELLQNKGLDHSAVLPYHMDNTVIDIMKLYNYDGEETAG